MSEITNLDSMSTEELLTTVADGVHGVYNNGYESGYTAGMNSQYEVDDTLTISGRGADAKAVGDALALKADKDEVRAIVPNWENVEGVLKEKVFLYAPNGTERSPYGGYNTLVVELEDGYIYRASFTTPKSTDLCGICFYDENSNFIQSSYIANTINFVIHENEIIDIPNGAKTMKVCTFDVNVTTDEGIKRIIVPTVEKSVELDFKQLVDTVYSNIEIAEPLEWENIEYDTWEIGLLNNTTGNFNTNLTNYYSVTVPIDKNYAYRVTTRMSNSIYTSLAVFYDANDNYIGHTSDKTGAASVYIYYEKERVNNIPPNASYMKVCSATHQYNDGTVDYMPIIEKAYIDDVDGLFTHTSELIEEVNNMHYLKNKIIVNFGDSIFGNSKYPYDISTMLAEITGATVHNCGFGGCRMATHSAGYIDFSMFSLANAIVAGDFSAQEASVSSVSIQNVADRVALLKTLDFNNVDIITIAYGTNDFTGGKPLDSETNVLDTTTFGGALRYSIETLLTAFPHLKIFVCAPTWRFWLTDGAYDYDSDTYTNSMNNKLTDFVEKTKEICKEYHIPCIDNYYELGFNKFNRSRYFSATDGTHPIKEGRRLMAEHIAKHLF